MVDIVPRHQHGIVTAIVRLLTVLIARSSWAPLPIRASVANPISQLRGGAPTARSSQDADPGVACSAVGVSQAPKRRETMAAGSSPLCGTQRQGNLHYCASCALDWDNQHRAVRRSRIWRASSGVACRSRPGSLVSPRTTFRACASGARAKARPGLRTRRPPPALSAARDRPPFRVGVARRRARRGDGRSEGAVKQPQFRARPSLRVRS